MKKNKIFALGCLLVLSTSCVDLNQAPQSWITEEEFIELPQNVETVEKSATGLYTSLWGGNYDFCCRMLRINACADQMASNPTKPLQYMIELQPSVGLNKGDDWNSPWKNFWTVIIGANKILNGTPIPEDANEAIKFNKTLGEVRFMRALSYFHLVRLFGDVPLITSQSEALGDPIRSSAADIYNKIIIPDLIKAIEVLPEVSRSASSDTPSKWAAKTMLADVYLTMAGWPLKLGKEYYAKAAAEAKDVIEKSGLQLEPTYGGLWQEETKTTTKEHLFAVHNSAKEKRASQYGTSFYPARYWNVEFNDGGGWADYYADPDYMNTYPAGDRKDFNFMLEWDIRDATSKVVTHVTWQEGDHGLPCIAKYQSYDNGKPGKSAQSNGITPVYRLADAYLFYAEASVQATGNVDVLAAKCLNDIQTRAGSAMITNTTDATVFTKAVFDEYGWEFFVEGAKRWFQLVRLEKVADVKPKVWNNSVFKANNHYIFPVPEAQIKLTSWSNNPGY